MNLRPKELTTWPSWSLTLVTTKGNKISTRCFLLTWKACSGLCITIIRVRSTGGGTTHTTMHQWSLTLRKTSFQLTWRVNRPSRSSKLTPTAARIKPLTLLSNNFSAFYQWKAWKFASHKNTLLLQKPNSLRTSLNPLKLTWTAVLFHGKQQSWSLLPTRKYSLIMNKCCTLKV